MATFTFTFTGVDGCLLIHDFNKSNKWVELLEEIGITKDKEKEFSTFWKSFEPKVSTGLDVDTLIPLIEREFKCNIPKNYSLLKDGFVSRFDQNKTIWPLVKKIKEINKVGLLTNQYPNMYDLLIKKGLLPDIS